MPTLLDELIVQGVRSSLSSSLASALSGGLASAVSSLAGHGMLGGLTFNDGALRGAVSTAQSQLPGAQPPTPAPAAGTGDTTEVSPLTVTAPAKPGAVGALGQIFSGAGGGSNTLAAGAGSDTIKLPPDQAATDSKTAEVSPLTVSPLPSHGIPPAALLLPAGVAGAALLATGGGGSSPPALANTVDPLTVTGQPPPAPSAGLTPTQAALGGGVAGGGTAAAVGAGGGDAPAAAAGADLGAYPDTLAGAGGGLPFGLTTKDLIAGALLGGSLLASGGAGGGGGGGNQDALKSLAANSGDLANRLGNIATAGMSGNIGGMGLNSIGHMVRKAQAAIRQRYASMGMSGSTAENQDLQAAADSGVDLQFKVGQEMATTGLNAIAALTGQSAQIYAQLLNAQTAKDTALGNALANFAGSLVR